MSHNSLTCFSCWFTFSSDTLGTLIMPNTKQISTNSNAHSTTLRQLLHKLASSILTHFPTHTKEKEIQKHTWLVNINPCGRKRTQKTQRFQLQLCKIKWDRVCRQLLVSKKKVPPPPPADCPYSQLETTHYFLLHVVPKMPLLGICHPLC